MHLKYRQGPYAREKKAVSPCMSLSLHQITPWVTQLTKRHLPSALIFSPFFLSPARVRLWRHHCTLYSRYLWVQTVTSEESIDFSQPFKLKQRIQSESKLWTLWTLKRNSLVKQDVLPKDQRCRRCRMSVGCEGRSCHVASRSLFCMAFCPSPNTLNDYQISEDPH